eukprot:3325600-Pyramimonas_sp.AAC.1
MLVASLFSWNIFAGGMVPQAIAADIPAAILSNEKQSAAFTSVYELSYDVPRLFEEEAQQGKDMSVAIDDVAKILYNNKLVELPPIFREEAPPVAAPVAAPVIVEVRKGSLGLASMTNVINERYCCGDKGIEPKACA